MINLFLDCEFTHLQEGAEPPGLISIGIISQDGKTFYAENANVQEELYSDFVIETVVPLLEGGESLMPYARIAMTLKTWIESFECETKLWTDAPSYDWPHVHHIFSTHGWPKNLKRSPVPLSFASGVQNIIFQNSVEDLFIRNPDMRRHHAMDDAFANWYGFQVATMWRY